MSADMSGVTGVLGGFGACPKIVVGDKTWTVGHPTQAAKSELELLVLRAAKDELARMKRVYTAQEFADEEAKLKGLIAKRQYVTWGQLWRDAIESPDWLVLFLCSLLAEHHPAVTLAEARQVFEGGGGDVTEALTVVIPGFFTLLVACLPASQADKDAALAEWKATAWAELSQKRPTQSSTSEK